MSTSGIHFSGLGSGIDTESIISQLSTLSQKAVQKIQTQQARIQQQQTSITQINALVSGLQAAASNLSNASGFTVVKASTADTTVATVSANTGAAAGSHALTVNQLAQSQRIGSAAQSSQTAALGVGGQIVINGKAINVSTTDSLQNLAANINGAQAGVSASIISTDASSFKLVLASTKTGASNTISLSDSGGGTILSGTLGLIGAGTTIRNPITNGAASNLFTDSSTSVATLLGQTTPASGAIQINGTSVNIDFGTDNLTSIATKINTAGITGITASVIAKTDADGNNRQQLQITGSTTPTFTDSNNLLANLGVVQNTPTSVLAVAKDANFTLDGLTITRSTNTVSDVLTGTTINLLKDSGTPTTTFNISPDTDTVKNNIGVFVSQYNQLARTVSNLSTFDSQTLATGPLFGDVTVQNTLNSITDILTNSVSGLSGSYASLAQIGITLDKSNLLNIDDAKLTSALNSNLTDVARIFQAGGVATDSSISFVSASDKTKASVSGPYAITITQLATQATLTAGTAHTANDNNATEVLSFTGGAFGSSGTTVLLNPNSTLDDIISQINANKTVSAQLTASKVGGKLTLTAKQYGSGSGFTVSSSQAAAANNSGIGSTAVTAIGQDVAGTINGEAATGKGQFLTGNSGNARTDGLQLRVTSTTTGSHGTLNFSQGLAAQTGYFANSQTDFINGVLTQYSNSLGQQVDDLSTEIQTQTDRIKAEQSRLREQFSAMDAAVSRIKAAGQGLAGLTTTTTK